MTSNVKWVGLFTENPITGERNAVAPGTMSVQP